MNTELIERLAVILAALELTPEELAAVVIEDCRNRGANEDEADRLRWQMADLIEPSPVGPMPTICGKISSLSLGPCVCERPEGHEGMHRDSDTLWV